jgi:hypothetical protein
MNAGNTDADSEVDNQGIITHTKEKVPVGTIVCPKCTMSGEKRGSNVERCENPM